MKLRISSYLARVSWFRRKNHKKKIQNKTKASYKIDFHAFFFFAVGVVARWEIRE